ncbi:hypothetical protein ACS0X5_18530 [Burkholderia gladioli]|uniref:hypothetical protein n=1 Tax=Burkholderia gladioli TaxID=28095 RepID=UPI001641ED23|nr:hypothetical protein [Burkholderia gladioli]
MLEALNDDGWNRRFNGLQAAHFRARRCIRGAGMCGKTQLCKLVLALARAIRAGVPEVAASIPLRWRTRGRRWRGASRRSVAHAIKSIAENRA